MPDPLPSELSSQATHTQRWERKKECDSVVGGK